MFFMTFILKNFKLAKKKILRNFKDVQKSIGFVLKRRFINH